VAKIILVGTTPTPLDRFGRKRSDFAKVALGAEEVMDWEYQPNIKPVIQSLKQDDFQVISLEQDERAQNLKDFPAPDQFALIVGNEVTGVSQEVLGISDTVVEIMMPGEKRSLNVAVATGVALFVLL